MRTLFGAADGVAYRFKLPLVGPPPPSGDRVDVEVAFIADSHAHFLCTDEPLCQHLVQHRQILHDVHVVQLVIDDVLWLLPMRKKSAEPTLNVSSIKAERWLLEHCQVQATRQSPSSPPTSQGRSNDFFYRTSWEDFRPRWDVCMAGPYDYRSRIPPPTGYGPLSSRTSQDANVVAHIPVYADRDDESDSEEEAWDDLTIEEELPINVALRRPINFIRYVDYLPRGDPFPMDARLFDRRLAQNEVWAVDAEMQTQFLATRTEPGRRMRAWQLLTTPSLGHPGKIEGRDFCYTLTNLCTQERLVKSSFKSGPAVLKLLPVSKDWACQPTSASPQASYMINNWRMVVEQDGVQHDVYNLRAKYIDYEVLQGFEHYAELASAEGAPGRIIYAQRPYWYGEDISGVGVRLRDGGSRFELDRIDDEKYEFKLPGDKHLHSKWGRFDDKDIKPVRRLKTPIMAQLRVPTSLREQDVIFRVNDSDVGDFHQLEYVLRRRNSYTAIKPEEWIPVEPTELDEWIICFFCNIAKVTWGCLNRDLLRPSSASTTDETVQPLQGAAANSNHGGEAESSSSARDKKKPRLS